MYNASRSLFYGHRELAFSNRRNRLHSHTIHLYKEYYIYDQN